MSTHDGHVCPAAKYVNIITSTSSRIQRAPCHHLFDEEGQYFIVLRRIRVGSSSIHHCCTSHASGCVIICAEDV